MPGNTKATRERNGQGGIRKRERVRRDGTVAVLYEAYLRLPVGPRLSRYGRTEAEARRKLAELRRLYTEGAEVDPDRVTVREFLESWLADIAPAGTERYRLAPSTYQRYGELVRLHVLPEAGRIRLGRVTAGHLQALYRGLLAEGLSAQTVLHVHRALHVAFGWAIRTGLLTRNVVDAAQPPRVATPERQGLTAEQSLDLLYAVAGDPFEALYVVAMNTALRPGELFALTWSDIDWEAGAATVRHGVRYLPGQGLTLQERKTRKVLRVELNVLAIGALEDHQARQLRTRQTAKVWEDSGLVFPNSQGGYMAAGNFNRRSWYTVRTRAGLPAVTFYEATRHTLPSLLLAAGVHPRIVSDMLGHARVGITMDRYSHVLPGLTKAASDKLAELLLHHQRTTIRPTPLLPVGTGAK